MFSIKSVYITVPHNSHSTILCVLASMVYVALRQITVQCQMQLSDENTSIHSNTDRVTNITVDTLYKIKLLYLYSIKIFFEIMSF